MQRETKEQMKKSINGWKIAFTVLLAFVIAVVGFTYYKITTPSVAQTTMQKQSATHNHVDIDVTLNKKQLSALINNYLAEQSRKTGMEYHFAIERDAILTGTTKILGENVSFTLKAQPEIDGQGNIVLKTQTLGVGLLPLPQSLVLKYIKNNYDLGPDVKINTQKGAITLLLSQMKTKNGFYVQATKIDVPHNQFKFQLAVPVE